MSVRFLAKCGRATTYVGRAANVATTLNEHARYAASCSTPGVSALTHQPDVRMIVPGGGIWLEGERWIASARLVPPRAHAFAPVPEAPRVEVSRCTSDRELQFFGGTYLALRKPLRPTWRPRGMGVQPSWPAGVRSSQKPTSEPDRARNACHELSCRDESADCVQPKLCRHHWRHMTSKERSCPLSFRPCRGLAPRLPSSPIRRVLNWVFVKQWGAQALMVRALSEGETIWESHHRFSSSRCWRRHAR
jgi:hypothetical protein